MHKESQVGPYIMNGVDLVMFNYHFHAHLAPGRYTYNVTDIPVWRIFNDLVQLFVPVFDPCNTSAGFIKSLEPEWPVLGKDATKVARIPAGLAFLKIRGAS